MTFFADLLPFSDHMRMTGIWTKARVEDADDEHLVGVHYIDLPEEQDADLEASMISCFLPFHAGGFYVVDEYDRPKLVVVQHCPCDRESTFAVRTDPEEILKGSLKQALEFNPEAMLSWQTFITRRDLLDPYIWAGLTQEMSMSWTTTELVHGLLAEMCGVPLSDIIRGREQRCAFPDKAHMCESDVFQDVFANWGKREISTD